MSAHQLADDEREALVRAMARAGDTMTLALSQLFADGGVRLGAVEPVESADWFAARLGPADLQGVTFDMRGPLHGRMLLAATSSGGPGAARRMGGRPLGPGPRAVETSLMELGNIAASHFLNGLARITGMTLLPSVPRWSAEPREELQHAYALSGGLSFASELRVPDEGDGARLAFVVAPASTSHSVITVALRARSR